jgi:hypothetical protein
MVRLADVGPSGEIIAPNIARINAARGEEDDAHSLAYARRFRVW